MQEDRTGAPAPSRPGLRIYKEVLERIPDKADALDLRAGRGAAFGRDRPAVREALTPRPEGQTSNRRGCRPCVSRILH